MLSCTNCAIRKASAPVSTRCHFPLTAKPANTTHNGIERNFEISARIEGSATCCVFARLVEALWLLAPPVGMPELLKGARRSPAYYWRSASEGLTVRLLHYVSGSHHMARLHTYSM